MVCLILAGGYAVYRWYDVGVQRQYIVILAERGWRFSFPGRRYDVNRSWDRSAIEDVFGGVFPVYPVTATVGNEDIPTNEDLEKLTHLPSIRAVYVVSWKSTIDDLGLKILCRLPHLETLYCRNASITDVSISRLAQCDSLHTLLISGERLTRRSIESFRLCSSLHVLTIDQPQMSLRDQNALRQSLPHCRVTFWQRPKRKRGTKSK